MPAEGPDELIAMQRQATEGTDTDEAGPGCSAYVMLSVDQRPGQVSLVLSCREHGDQATWDNRAKLDDITGWWVMHLDRHAPSSAYYESPPDGPYAINASPMLLRLLRGLGDEWGPSGVAKVAWLLSGRDWPAEVSLEAGPVDERAGWMEEARCYSQNADHWRGKAEELEARVSALTADLAAFDRVRDDLTSMSEENDRLATTVGDLRQQVRAERERNGELRRSLDEELAMAEDRGRLISDQRRWLGFWRSKDAQGAVDEANAACAKAVVERDELGAINAGLCGELDRLRRELALRDQQVEGLREIEERQERSIDGLRADVEHLLNDCSELNRLNGRLAAMLDGVAVALKGEPAPLTLHDWTDLPDLARRTVAAAGSGWAPLPASSTNVCGFCSKPISRALGVPDSFWAHDSDGLRSCDGQVGRTAGPRIATPANMEGPARG